MVSKDEFEEIYSLYSKELMNVSYGYTKNKDDALDIIQNVFLKYFNKNKSFPSEDARKYWLIRITINESLDFIKSQNRVVILEDDKVEAINYQNTDDNVDPRLEKLSILVKKLPEKYRRVVVLHYYDSMPIKEISKTLNISDSAIKKRLERARNILKEGMNE